MVDADGIGGAVVDYCTALEYKIFSFNGGESAYDSRKYGNRRAEIWGKGKFWLEAGAQIPDDEELASAITGPHFYYREGKANHGSLMIERKEDMARRGLASPDEADTLFLTHAVEVAPPDDDSRQPPPRRTPSSWLGV